MVNIDSEKEVDPDEIKAYYKKFFLDLKENELKITKNIDKVIKKFYGNKDFIMCITSSSYRNEFEMKQSKLGNNILKQVFNLEKNIYLCPDIENCRFKPEADIFKYALKDIEKKYGLQLTKNDNVLIIEDSTAGCRAGQNFKNDYGNKVNINVIGYLGGTILGNRDTLLQNGADIVIKDAEELIDYIAKLHNCFLSSLIIRD